MPNKRNGIYRGKPKHDLRSLYSEEGIATNDDHDLQIQEENLNILLDMFRNVDKEIVQAVLQEYDYNLKDSMEKLGEISGERSMLNMEEKNEIDLAIIACSLLDDENQSVGTSRLDIYDAPEDLSADLGCAAMSDTFPHEENLRSSMSSRSTIPHKYAAESMNGKALWPDQNVYPELNNIQSFNIINNKNNKISKQTPDFLNSSTDSTSLLKGTEDSKMKSDFLNSLHSFTNMAVSANNTDTEAYYFNMGNLNTSADHFEKYTDYPKVDLSLADMKRQRNVINNEFYTIDEKVKSQGKVPSNNPAMTNIQDGSYLNSLFKPSNEWDTFYSNIEPDVFNAYSESMNYVDASETEHSFTKMPPVSSKTAYPPTNSTVSVGNKVNNGNFDKNTSQTKTHLPQKNSTAQTSAHVNSDYTVESSEIVSSSAGAKKSSCVNRLQKFASSNGQNMKASNSTLHSGDDKNTSSKVKLSPSALEFIPRPLTISQSKHHAQDKAAAVEDQKSDMFEALKPSQTMSPGKKKGHKGKKSKEQTKIKSNDLILDNGLIGFSQSFKSDDYTSSSEDNVQMSRTSEWQTLIDHTDPLGWGYVFSKITPTVESKPKSSKKAKKFANGKSNQLAPSPAFPPWQMSVDKLGESKLNASRVSSLMMKHHVSPAESVISEANAWPSIHEKSENGSVYHLSNSENSTSSANISRTQILYESSIATRLPPSLSAKTAPTTLATKVTPLQETVHNIPPPKSSSKKNSMQMTLETTKPQSSVPVPQLIKNKLQLRGIKTPVGVIRRYILEKQPVMIILRGLPGSGKTYLARQLIAEGQQMGVQGVILSTDDYFLDGGQYCFNKNNLPDAHDWNKKRALQCMKKSCSPVIIDNTNTTMWELLPYVVLALEHSYDVQIFEPDTSWKMKVIELARKNSHGVRKEHIRKMKDRWESFTLDDVLKQGSQSVASRKTSAIVPVDTGLSPAEPATQQTLPLDNQVTKKAAEKVHITEVNHQKSSNGTSNAPLFQDLGLSDWFGAQTQSSKKTKKKHIDSQANPSDKSPKMEITQDFLNKSLKKAMVSLLKMPPPQVVESLNSSDVSQTGNSTKNSMSDNNRTNRITIKERQLSNESWNSDSETPTVDKDIEIFGKNSELSSVMNLKHSAQKDITDLSPEVSSDLVEDLTESEIMDSSSALNNSLSTCDSYHTLPSNSDSYHTVNGDEEYMDGFSTDILNDDDIEHRLVIKQEVKELQELQSQSRNAGNFSSMTTEAEMLPVYFEKMAVASEGDEASAVVDEQYGSEKCDSCIKRKGADNVSSLMETAPTYSNDNFLSADGIQTEPFSTESLSVLDQFCSTTVVISPGDSDNMKNTAVVTSLGDSDCKKKTTVGSLALEVRDSIIPNTSSPNSLVEYSDSDDSDKELPVLQNDEFIASSNITEPHIDEHIALDDNVLNSLTVSTDNIFCLTSENVAEHGQVDVPNYIQNDRVSNRAYVREISVDRSTQSSEDSVTSATEQIPQVDSEAVTAGVQLTKKKKRVKKGRNPEPFIEDSLKIKSKMHNWSSFVAPLSGSSNYSGDSGIYDCQGKQIDTSSSTTQTDPYYFSIIYKLNSPAFNNLQPVDLTLSGVDVITSSPQSAINERWISRSNDTDTVLFRKICSTVDQSTITDETLEKEELDLETLQSCFPEYSRKQLEATMAICHGDLEWVTSHLLDSPALYDMEEDEDAGMKADELKPEKEMMTPGTPKRTVSSLANICTTVVRKTNKVDADDLEMQVIQVGEGRLKKIEMFGRSRLHSLSQEDLGNQNYWPDDFVLDEYPLNGTTQDFKKRQQNLGHDQPNLFKSSPFDHESTLHSSNFLVTSAKKKQFTPSSEGEENQEPNYPSLPKSEDSSSDVLIKHQETKHITEVSQRVKAQNLLVMPLEFVRQLESLYGPLQLQKDDGVSGLTLDDSISRKIYNCLKLQAVKNALKSADEQQLKNDEALARALQAEENSKTSNAANYITASVAQESSRQSTVPGWTKQNPSWMSLGRDKTQSSLNGSINISGESKTFRPHSVADTLNQLRGTKGNKVRAYKFQHKMPRTVKSVWYTAQKRGQVDSLISIMEEEMAREEQQREQIYCLLHKIESTGDMEALATRIKRIELSNLFPSMGPDVLDDIFRSTGYSKEETIRVLQESYNIPPAPISKDKEDIFDQFRKSQEDFQHVEGLFEDEYPGENSETAYDVLRNEARLCRQLFNDCQQQALRYQSDGMQGAALFYRQRAKKYKEDERAANSRAAQVLFEKGSERLHVENTLDLHFYHLDEAINAVNMAIEMKEEEYKKRSDRKSSYLDIVTGWGRNSKNGIPKLKPAIIHHLYAKCFQYEERSPGMLRVYLCKKL